MARRLLAAGYDLTVHDRARERARPLEQDGAKFAPTPKRLAAAVNVVLSSLTAAQVCAVEHVRHNAQGDEDFSAVIRTAQQMAGLAEWTLGSEVLG